MIKTYGLKTARDLLRKLGRDAELLRAEVSSDRFFNYVITAQSLKDWINNDPMVPDSAKADIKRFCELKELKIIRDLANASKHFVITTSANRPLTVTDAKSDQGFGGGRFGLGCFGVGEEHIIISLIDGKSYNALDLVQKSLWMWNEFFILHKI